MKIIDRYILSSFAKTFITVFVILFFIFILQMIWLFIAELAGKDLDINLVGKFLLFGTPRLIPLILPLTILLSSIMTFGDFAENYEFAAMKSSGISLNRVMRISVVFILFLSAAVFIFANNVIPYAEYRFINFRRNIAQVKPAMAIAEGQFNTIGNFNIKVDEKSGDNGQFLKNVTIHKKTNSENNTVIKAQNGELVSSENSNILKLVLKDGYYYEDIIQKFNTSKIPFVKSSFETYVLNIDLSKYNSVNMDEESISNTNTMLNVSELKYTLDSLQNVYHKEMNVYVDNIHNQTGISSNQSILSDSTLQVKTDLLANLTKDEKLKILRTAESYVINSQYTISGNKTEFEYKSKNIAKHVLAFHEKFAVAFACIILFFIGAPLGAIIRKGGIGLPLVFAIGIFLSYHFINIFSKKLAEEQGIDPTLGAWLSALVLFPFGIYLTYKASNDSSLFQTDKIAKPLRKFFKKINFLKQKKQPDAS